MTHGELPSTDLRIYLSLIQDGPQTTKSLAINVGRDNSSAHRVLIGLERNGIVESQVRGVKTGGRIKYWSAKEWK